MKLHQAVLASVMVGAQLMLPGLFAQDTNTVEVIRQLQKRIEELERKVTTLEQEKAAAGQPEAGKPRVEELQQQVKELQHEREADQEAAEARAKAAPKLVIGDRGFSFASADTNFAVQLKGILQVDSRTFFDDGGIVGNDGIILRRARPILQGTVFRDFDFTFVPDFGGTSVQIVDVYLNYRLRPELQFQAGKYKAPVGLELLQSDIYTFFNERALPTALVPNRDLGFELHGDVWDGRFSYAVGVFNGLGDARSSSNVDFEDDKAFVGRVFVLPFKQSSVPALQGFGAGLGGSYEGLQGTNTTGLPNTTGGTLPGYTTSGQQQFFAYNPAGSTVVAGGEHWRLSPQGYWYYGPFGLLGEYVISEQAVTRAGAGIQPSARLANTAWQLSAGWVLTGEDASYNAPVVPRHPFNPLQGGWGAVQLVARYAQLNLDDAAFPSFSNPLVSARSVAEWAVGLNWWWNRNVRVNGSFSHAEFAGGGGPGASPPANVTRQSENVLFTRVQLAF